MLERTVAFVLSLALVMGAAALLAPDDAGEESRQEPEVDAQAEAATPSRPVPDERHVEDEDENDDEPDEGHEEEREESPGEDKPGKKKGKRGRD